MSPHHLSHLPATPGWALVEPVGDCSAVYEQPIIGWRVETSNIAPDAGAAAEEWHTTVHPITAEGAWYQATSEWLIRQPDGRLMEPNNTALLQGASALAWFRECRARRGEPLAPMSEVARCAMEDAGLSGLVSES